MNDISRNEQRRRILTKRDAMAPAMRSRKSQQVAARLWQLPEFASTRTLFIYVNFRSEVETLPLIRQALARGMRVAVPLTEAQGRRLLPLAITDPDQDLRPGYRGIPEPVASLPAVEPVSIDTVVLPGSVFDLAGGRLGYGGGYYDRFLTLAAPRALRIGLAFEEQVAAKVELLDHDVRLHILVTEERTVRCTMQR